MEETTLLNESLREAAKAFRELAPLVNNSSGAQITVSAGGVGIWVAVVAALMSFLMMVVMLFLYLDQSRQVDDLKDYLSAIYMAAPHLKPKE